MLKFHIFMINKQLWEIDKSWMSMKGNACLFLEDGGTRYTRQEVQI